MRKNLKNEQILLADCMSSVSERCYYAGWMHNLEYILWDAVLHGQRHYGHGTISEEDVKTLQNLSKKADVWIIFDDETEETALALEQWKQKFNEDVDQNPELLKG